MKEQNKDTKPVKAHLQKIIEGRRSISSFTPDSISKELVDELISVASHAPSSCNTQPWFFLVFHSEESKQKLNEFIKKGYERTAASIQEKHGILGGVYGKLLEFFSQYGKFDEAPIYILLFARTYDTPLFSQAIRFSRNYQIEAIANDSVKTSVAMAMQNFLLIAHERWLWTRVKDGIKFLVNFEDLKNEFYKKFGISEDYELISGIQLGYPTKEALQRKTPKKLPLEKIRKIV